MRRSQLKESGLIIALGALNGVIYTASALLIIRKQSEHLLQRAIEESESLGTTPVQLTTNNLNLPMISLFLIVLFIAASFLINRYWQSLQNPSILFWQIVGLGAVVGWNVLILSLFWLESKVTGQSISYERVTSHSNPLFGPISIGVVMIVNLMYAMLIKLFSGLFRLSENVRP